MEQRKSIEQLEKDAQDLLAQAREKGVENAFLFETSFQRYCDLIAHLEELQKSIDESGTMVTKEYVKGRANLYVNPAIVAYNQTAGAACKEATLLLRCISTLPGGGADDEDEFDRFDH